MSNFREISIADFTAAWKKNYNTVTLESFSNISLLTGFKNEVKFFFSQQNSHEFEALWWGSVGIGNKNDYLNRFQFLTLF